MPNEQSIEGLPRGLAEIVARAAAGDAWLVGGFVRDRLLGRPSGDVDVAVAGDARAIARRIAGQLGGSAFPLSEQHGAWRVTPAADSEWQQLDITRLRGSLEQDLRLRDFTINAIALPLAGGAPVDPLHGIADLRLGLVRAVSQTAVIRDPIRALRAVRHVTELRMQVEADTAALIRREAALLAGVSGERQRDELARILDTAFGAAGLRVMDELGLLGVVLPELEPARGCGQPPEHFWDVLEHSIETVAVLDCLLRDEDDSEGERVRSNAERSRRGSAPSQNLDRGVAGGGTEPPGGGIGTLRCEERRREPGALWSEALAAYWEGPITPPRSRRAVLKLVGLLHDAGKAACRRVEADGRIRFFGHDERGGEIVEGVFQRLRFSSAETRYAALLVREHLRPGQLAQRGEVPSARALFRLFRDVSDALPDLLLLNLADGAAAAGPRQRAEDWAAHVAYATWILGQREAQREQAGPRRLVTGHDLIAELGMEPGAALGRVLQALAEAQAAGEVSSREAALALAKSLWEGDPERGSGLG